MLKIYNVYDYVSIDGADWRRVGVSGYRASEEQLETTLILDNVPFDEAYEYFSWHALYGVVTDTTLFRKKPVVLIKYNDAWDSVSYKQFKTISYRRKYLEWSEVSLEWIIKHLSADQAIQYLKERGITTCPILK